ALLVVRALVAIERLTPAQAEARLTALVDSRELAALTAAVEKNPNKSGAYWNRAAWYAGKGRWQECARDHLARVELKPSDSLAWLPAATTLILAGDEGGYRALCR